jgi:hypothetical protein
VNSSATQLQFIQVGCHPWPLQLATIRFKVFEDSISVNGEYDDGEVPLAGFRALVNTIEGPCFADYFGNDIRYANAALQRHRCSCTHRTHARVCRYIYSDENGDLVIPNMFPHRYDIAVLPPVDDNDWIYTATLEGNLN